MMDNSDVLCSKYIGIVVGLPDDASKWSLPLCTTYFSALVISLQDKIDEENFDMLSHSGLLTKTLHMQALHIVREAAAKSFKALNDEEKRIRRLICTANVNQGSMNFQESTETN